MNKDGKHADNDGIILHCCDPAPMLLSERYPFHFAWAKKQWDIEVEDYNSIFWQGTEGLTMEQFDIVFSLIQFGRSSHFQKG
jgi:hypothetical protein